MLASGINYAMVNIEADCFVVTLKLSFNPYYACFVTQNKHLGCHKLT
jgi:hypothetical protein